MSSNRSLLNRSLGRLRQAWAELNTTLRRNDRLQFDPSLSERDIETLRQRIRGCLAMPGGEYARRAEATRIGHAYAALNPAGRERFLRLLSTDFDIEHGAIEKAIEAYRQAGAGADRSRRLLALRQSLVAPRAQLLTLFNALPEGIKFLVDMRGELLDLGAAADPALREVEQDLKRLLAGWFDIGFLQLRRLDWNSPAAFLEKLIEYEAVHEITGWDDLKHRLAGDRRLYAFVHPNMAEEPLIFVQVALCENLATSVQALLDHAAEPLEPEAAGTAIFYSISSAQRGLAGISFGNYLIRRVVADLRRELPRLSQFATLSPIPGFAGWLHETTARGDAPLSTAEREVISARATAAGVEASVQGLLGIPGWHIRPELADCLQPVLMRACARYLALPEPGKLRARDAVAHFHLGNGAIVQQLDWLGDTSAKGIAQSCGMMVNYLYDPREIDRNSEAYSRDGSIACSGALRELLKPPRQTPRAQGTKG